MAGDSIFNKAVLGAWSGCDVYCEGSLVFLMLAPKEVIVYIGDEAARLVVASIVLVAIELKLAPAQMRLSQSHWP